MFFNVCFINWKITDFCIYFPTYNVLVIFQLILIKYRKQNHNQKWCFWIKCLTSGCIYWILFKFAYFFFSGSCVKCRLNHSFSNIWAHCAVLKTYRLSYYFAQAFQILWKSLKLWLIRHMLWLSFVKAMWHI